jgi:mRNA interferase RelE/StbE
MSGIYRIVLKQSVLKDLRRIPRSIVRVLQERILALAQDPVPSGAEPIEGYQHWFRIRIGNYRVVYHVAKSIEIITVIKIGHRKDVYRSL